MKELLKNAILFVIFALFYYTVETIFKYPKPSHWTMGILGGFLGLIVGGLNNYLPWEMPLWRQCFYGMIYITMFEGITGVILNVWLKLGIWDYSQVPLNFFFGQCSIPFCLAWFVLSGVCIVMDDWLRYWMFGDERPRYRFL